MIEGFFSQTYYEEDPEPIVTSGKVRAWNHWERLLTGGDTQLFQRFILELLSEVPGGVGYTFRDLMEVVKNSDETKNFIKRDDWKPLHDAIISMTEGYYPLVTLTTDGYYYITDEGQTVANLLELDMKPQRENH